MKNSAKKQFNFSKGKRFLLLSLTMGIVAVAVWVFHSIYVAANSSTIPIEAENATTPLDPNLNLSVLDQLEAKPLYTDQDLLDFPIYVVKQDQGNRTQEIIPLERQTPNL